MNTIPRTIIISTTSSTAARLARKMHKDDEKHLNEKVVEEDVLNQQGIDPETAMNNPKNNEDGTKIVGIIFSIMIVFLIIAFILFAPELDRIFF